MTAVRTASEWASTTPITVGFSSNVAPNGDRLLKRRTGTSPTRPKTGQNQEDGVDAPGVRRRALMIFSLLLSVWRVACSRTSILLRGHGSRGGFAGSDRVDLQLGQMVSLSM